MPKPLYYWEEEWHKMIYGFDGQTRGVRRRVVSLAASNPRAGVRVVRGKGRPIRQSPERHENVAYTATVINSFTEVRSSQVRCGHVAVIGVSLIQIMAHVRGCT